MKILIVSGFLGAGKTTFIKELIRRTGKSFVILENEYGTTDVDEQILSTQSDADVWDLTEGCICCTKSAELTSSVITIQSALDPEYLIVEPSGVGALSNVIANLSKICYDRITLLAPLTIVDAFQFAHDYKLYHDVYEDQIKATRTIVISKPDSPSSELRQDIIDVVEQVNPQATLIPTHYTCMNQSWWDSLLTTTYDGKSLETVAEATLDLETFTLSDCTVANPTEMLWIVEQALRGSFGEIQRAKGMLPAGSDWVRFDIVGSNGALTGFEEGEEPDHAECVWIGKAIDRIALLRALHVEHSERGDKTDASCAHDHDDACHCHCCDEEHHHHHHTHDGDHHHCHDDAHHHDHGEECCCEHESHHRINDEEPQYLTAQSA